jgi:hypothetical protein
MIWTIDPTRFHANTIEEQADNENKRQQAKCPSQAFALSGMQKGIG